MQKEKVILKNKKSDLRKLVLLMNQQNKRSFPPVDPLLESLDYVLSREELPLLLRLGTEVYAYDQALVRSGMAAEKFKPLFESLIQKGFMGIKLTVAGEDHYALLPFVVGWFEAQVSYLLGRPEEKEFARRWTKFYNYFQKYNFFPLRNIINMALSKSSVTHQSVGLVHATRNARGKSIINIHQTINVPDTKIYPTRSINDLIHDYGTKGVIGQLTCMCRRITSNIDDPCRLKIPDDGGCFGFGDFVKPAIKYGYARRISREEAFDILQKVRDQGAIHSVFHEYDDTGFPQMGLCNCCWDCCGILRSYNMGALPLRYQSFYLAKIANKVKCTGCKKCEKYCPTAAISMVNEKASINEARCIGCGQCVHQCSFSAVELIENQRTAFLPILKKSEARLHLKQV